MAALASRVWARFDSRATSLRVGLLSGRMGYRRGSWRRRLEHHACGRPLSIMQPVELYFPIAAVVRDTLTWSPAFFPPVMSECPLHFHQYRQAGNGRKRGVVGGW